MSKQQITKTLKEKRKKVVVVGATGDIGSLISSLLIKQLKKEAKKRGERLEVVLFGRGTAVEGTLKDAEYFDYVAGEDKFIIFNRITRILNYIRHAGRYANQKLEDVSEIKVSYNLDAKFSTNEKDLEGADLVVFAAGISAATLGSSNREAATPLVEPMVNEYGELIGRYAGNATVLSICNPVDITTNMLFESSNLPPERILGFGCDLDAKRFNIFLANKLRKLGIKKVYKISSRVIGGHSKNNMIVLMDTILINGKPLSEFKKKFNQEMQDKISIAVKESVEEMRDEGFNIIRSGAKSIKSPASMMTKIALALLGYGNGVAANCSMVLNGENSFCGVNNTSITVPIKIEKTEGEEMGKVSIDRSVHVSEEEIGELNKVACNHEQQINNYKNMNDDEKNELTKSYENFLEAKEDLNKKLQKFSNKSNDQGSNKEDYEHTGALKFVLHIISVEEDDGKDSKLKISLKEEIKEEGREEDKELFVSLMKYLMGSKSSEGIDQKKIDQCKNEGVFTVEDNDKVRNIFKELGIKHPQEERPNSTTSSKSAAEKLKNATKGKNDKKDDDYSR